MFKRCSKIGIVIKENNYEISIASKDSKDIIVFDKNSGAENCERCDLPLDKIQKPLSLKDLEKYLKNKIADINIPIFFHRIFLFEWKEYEILIKEKKGNDEKIEDGRKIKCIKEEGKVKVKKWGRHFEEINLKKDGQWYHKFSFQNELGKSEIHIKIDNEKPIIIPVEVISEKLYERGESDEKKLYERKKDDEKKIGNYIQLFTSMVKDIVKQIATLPFEISTPTYEALREIPLPAHPLFYLAFFKSYKDKIRGNLQFILSNPHSVLLENLDFVPFNEVSEITPEVIEGISYYPEKLQKSETISVVKTGDKRYAPTEVLQYICEETYDTPENRFIKFFIKEMLKALVEVKKIVPEEENLNQKGKKLKDEFNELESTLNNVLKNPFFEEVGEMRHFPFYSQVLLKRDGYREILDLYRKFLFARHPFWMELSEALNLRRIDKIYEYWCFFELIKRLRETICSKDVRIKLETGKEGGLKEGKVKAEFKDKNYEIRYNEHFAGTEDNNKEDKEDKEDKKKSYSVPLIPDYSLFKDKECFAVFDAKFRLDWKVMEEEEEEEDIELKAKKADIYKMHTYKDALRIKSATILYPGDEKRFYKEDEVGEDDKEEDILSKIVKEELRGIGVLPFLPSMNEK